MSTDLIPDAVLKTIRNQSDRQLASGIQRVSERLGELQELMVRLAGRIEFEDALLQALLAERDRRQDGN